MISNDLAYLISQSVNTDMADYAVITGVLIHNWSKSGNDKVPHLEFVMPTQSYIVVDGRRTDLDLHAVRTVVLF